MTEIISTDLIFATVTQRGRVVANVALRGITSLTDVLRSIPSLPHGLASVSLRNSTRGWSQTRMVLLS